MAQKPHSLLGKFLLWRAKNIPQDRFVLILSIIVGLIAGLVAVVLKNTTHFIQELIHSGYLNQYFNVYYFLFPIVGVALTLLVKRWIRVPVGEGIPSALFAISRRSGFIKPHKMFASIITSVFTVGFGGSVGLEGPTVSTGSAIGSNLGRLMHLNYRQRILMIGCATAGAIASIFNAPIAAIIFTIEIFSLDLTLVSLVPLLLASVSGAVTSIFIQGNDSLFQYASLDPFRVEDLPWYGLLGVFTALVSVYFNKVYFFFDDYFTKISSKWKKLILGGIALGLSIWLIPPLYGEGFETINALLNGDVLSVVKESFLFQKYEGPYVIMILLLGLVFVKILAAVFTMGAGGVGGIFAPSLFVGSALGFVFAFIIVEFGIGDINTTNFALVGMAGLMAGVLHAPLTAIFMIAEITSGYNLFIPLMAVSTISYLVTRNLMPFSIYNMQLAKRGELITHNKDHAILTLLSLKKVIEDDFKKVSPEMNLGELVKVVSRSRRNLFPVIDADDALVGVLTLDDFRGIMFESERYEETFVSELMSPPPAIIESEENMNEVMKKFQSTGAWNLPVVENGKYIGFVSKSKLFSVYRRKLMEFG
ncbi:chloride channel protein [Croceimicrobium sp.]|uniref:chloride channel protein n=1 Tax=Croceimicrobium sp. TaxID=2828340 RepID=UPI003BAA6963